MDLITNILFLAVTVMFLAVYIVNLIINVRRAVKTNKLLKADPQKLAATVVEIQDSASIKVRKFLGPICSFASRFVWISIFLGIILGLFDLVIVGIALMGITILFQLVTLPVEFDASKRAIAYLDTVGYDEYTMIGVKKMLTAAAFTYVASTVAALLQMLRLILSFTRND